MTDQEQQADNLKRFMQDVAALAKTAKITMSDCAFSFGVMAHMMAMAANPDEDPQKEIDVLTRLIDAFMAGLGAQVQFSREGDAPESKVLQ